MENVLRSFKGDCVGTMMLYCLSQPGLVKDIVFLAGSLIIEEMAIRNLRQKASSLPLDKFDVVTDENLHEINAALDATRKLLDGENCDVTGVRASLDRATVMINNYRIGKKLEKFGDMLTSCPKTLQEFQPQHKEILDQVRREAEELLTNDLDDSTRLEVEQIIAGVKMAGTIAKIVAT